ncbi:integrase core domain-containing protein [Planosporangium sp. 12N6]|uniref:integrase core domain-containing protein n=1 Tax=Planosporangium spinosum TaxID=3402278 RepID=UPI003CF10652
MHTMHVPARSPPASMTPAAPWRVAACGVPTSHQLCDQGKRWRPVVPSGITTRVAAPAPPRGLPPRRSARSPRPHQRDQRRGDLGPASRGRGPARRQNPKPRLDRAGRPPIAPALADAGITVCTIPPHSPRANAYAERFMLTIRPEATNRMLILDERHLGRALDAYARHDSGRRPHRPWQLQPPRSPQPLS